MSHQDHFVFTDVIKDVIGNYPVLDQFDISYAAGFYGTMADDFITGSMLVKLSKGKYDLNVPRERGRAFSQRYARNESPILADWDGVNPSLAFRQRPPYEKAGNLYRATLAFDENERIYDTCLPNFASSIAANGSQIWFKLDDPDNTDKEWISPYRNLDSEKVGYIFFNDLPVEREGFSSDPLVDNDWTWSFPFESRYASSNRTLSTSDVLGISSVRLGVRLTGSSYYSVLSGTNYVSQASSGSVIEIGEIEKFSSPRSCGKLIPIMPGMIRSSESPPSGFRNSRRRCITLGSGSQPLHLGDPFLQFQQGQDEFWGFSYLFATDVNLNSSVDFSYLSAHPEISVPIPAAAHPVTGTMTYEDTIRNLYGFGDMNTLCHTNWLIDLKKKKLGYQENFEGSADGDRLTTLGTYTLPDVMTVDWAGSTAPNFVLLTPWRILKKSGTLINPIDGVKYNILSSSPGAVGWISSSNPSSDYVAVSETEPVFGGDFTDPIPPTDRVISLSSVDITSSYPWTINYDRAINAAAENVFFVYFSGMPGFPSSNMELYGDHNRPYSSPLACIDCITGSGTPGSDEFVKNYDFLNPEKDYHPIPNTTTFNNWMPNPIVDLRGRRQPLPPGCYRLVFSYIKTTNGVSPGNAPDIAIFDNLKIHYFDESAFEPNVSSPRVGGNNYPRYKRKMVDVRHRPLQIEPLTSGSIDAISGSANFYSSHCFGIAPEIRGWKYGLYSGFNQHTRVAFRRDRYGQVRDMLEQRIYTKSVLEQTSPCDNESIISPGYYKELAGPPKASGLTPSGVTEGPVTVKFVKRSYEIDGRGIGRIKTTQVSPAETTSQNLSAEVTSSLPYFDNVARNR